MLLSNIQKYSKQFNIKENVMLIQSKLDILPDKKFCKTFVYVPYIKSFSQDQWMIKQIMTRLNTLKGPNMEFLIGIKYTCQNLIYP